MNEPPRPYIWWIVALFLGSALALWLIITGGDVH